MTPLPRAARSVPLRVAAMALPLLLLAGCASTSTAPTAGIAVDDARVRPPMGPGQPAAGYLTITAPQGAPDALVGASSPAAGSVEIHETSTDASGMMGMHPVDRVPLPAGTAVRLEPGGYHLMLMDLTDDLEAGGTIDLVLEFETAGAMTINAAVREE